MHGASKHAIKGIADAFRIELKLEGSPNSLTLIKPASINTPFPKYAKNYFNQEIATAAVPGALRHVKNPDGTPLVGASA